jgi:hypothetical protein
LLKRGHEEVFIELVHVELSEMCVNLASCENFGPSFEMAKGYKKSVDGIHNSFNLYNRIKLSRGAADC